jgi:hypothetical protein
MRRALLVVSVLAYALLGAAQLGSILEFVMIPAPTPATNGPQGPADLAFGLMAVVGGGLGLAAAAGAGILGLALAASERRRSWLIAIIASGALVLVGFAISAFVLIGLPRNAYHPLIVCLVVPLTTLAYLGATRNSHAKA